MKTAISVPDHVFRHVEKVAAAHGMNRSQFYTAAAERYAGELETGTVTEAVNEALDAAGSFDVTDADTGVVTDAGLRYLADSTVEW